MMSHTRRDARRPKTALLAGALALLAPAAAVAAPFCVQSQTIPPQCLYYDASECNQRALQLGGNCTVNPQEVHVSVGLGHYCLLTSSLVSSCIYADATACAAEAKHEQGACIEAPTRPESPAADPYRDVRPSMAGG
jgi:hypothetical protein